MKTQQPLEEEFFAKIVERVAGSGEVLHHRYSHVPFLPVWSLLRIFQIWSGYGNRLQALDVNWSVDPPEVVLHIEQSAAEMAQSCIIDHASAQDDPVAVASAALGHMFPKP